MIRTRLSPTANIFPLPVSASIRGFSLASNGYNYVADRRHKLVSEGDVPSGDHVLSIEFMPTGDTDSLKGKGTPANVKLFVDGTEVGEGDMEVTVPIQFGLAAGFIVGNDNGLPVMLDDEYLPPFAVTGTIHKALVDITGEPLEDRQDVIDAYLKAATTRQ